MLRFYTAGESHGQALLAFISGLPASLPIDVNFINHELHRRQLGYGRGGRQKIEKDRAEIFAGVRHGQTIGAPVALRIENRDWANWEKILGVNGDLDSPLRCVDSTVQNKMKAEVDAALKAGDTVGGIFEVIAHKVPIGLGSHAQWDEKLDGRLAQAVMSIQAVKGVEIGAGVAAAGSYGSEVQDEISYDKSVRRFRRSSNRAGGLEGGITNGEDLIVRGYLKPISTLRRTLGTADMVTKEPVQAAYERSDWCVVPAAGVVGEAMVALVLADAFLQKFGGDSLAEMQRNFDAYARQIDAF